MAPARPRPAWALLAGLAVLWSCAQRASRSSRSFEQIRGLVAGSTERRVAALLGPPDEVEEVAAGEERWIWRHYTFLAGDSYALALRGHVVDLLIVFDRPDRPERSGPPPASPPELWRVRDPFAVSYWLGEAAPGLPPAGHPQLLKHGV